jgi:ABC-type glycerol-3-phosphate transport system permease component
MAIISTIGRKHWTVRLLIWGIYAGLTLGAASMLYPFGLMIAGSTKSNVDTPDPELIPRYLVDDVALWQKHSEALMNESFELARVAFRTDALTFRDLSAPKASNSALVELWREFCETEALPFYTHTIGCVHVPRSRGAQPSGLRAFKRLLGERYGSEIDYVNRELGTEFTGWNSVYVRPQTYLVRRERPGVTALHELFREFKATRPLNERVYFSLEGYFRYVFLAARYGRDIADYNASHGTDYTDWSQVHLSRRTPGPTASTARERQDWEEFVRSIANLYWIRVDDTAADGYRTFLQVKHGTLEALNRNYGSRYASWEEIPLITEPPMGGMALSDWSAWIEGWVDPVSGNRYAAPLEALRVHSVDFMFRDWLQARFGSISSLTSRISSAAITSWLDILPPQEAFLHREFLPRTAELRKEYSTRNFVAVIDYIVLHGRGIVNTVIYCALAILAAVIVNPLAAYALSRFKPPSQYKVLLFLMLTMAFPPMVTQIPVFLMLRELHLLNTFAALVLPGLANGYSIFLLKGFFDSLPQELYESAEIDGASEFRIFWQITMSLSKPILAVIALNAFNMAYANFMMALLICQNEKMWTLMPWLYQLQSRSSEGVVFASLLIAAIPTLLVFAFCQNIIMRGIVVPVEK